MAAKTSTCKNICLQIKLLQHMSHTSDWQQAVSDLSTLLISIMMIGILMFGIHAMAYLCMFHARAIPASRLIVLDLIREHGSFSSTLEATSHDALPSGVFGHHSGGVSVLLATSVGQASDSDGAQGQKSTNNDWEASSLAAVQS